MPFDPIAEQCDELRVHERIIVGDVEDMDRCLLQGLLKPFDQTGAMLRFHHEDLLGPCDIREYELPGRLWAEPARPHAEAGIVAENAFGGRTAPLVSRADEQGRDAGHRKVLGGLGGMPDQFGDLDAAPAISLT